MKQRNRSRSRASTLRGPRGRVRRGTAAVEAVFVLIMMIPLLLGSLEGSRIAEVQQILSNAAREGARQAASGQLTVAQTKQVVTYYLQDAGLPAVTTCVLSPIFAGTGIRENGKHFNGSNRRSDVGDPADG
jgi:Flp pilus assembly protein TadG